MPMPPHKNPPEKDKNVLLVVKGVALSALVFFATLFLSSGTLSGISTYFILSTLLDIKKVKPSYLTLSLFVALAIAITFGVWAYGFYVLFLLLPSLLLGSFVLSPRYTQKNISELFTLIFCLAGVMLIFLWTLMGLDAQVYSLLETWLREFSTKTELTTYVAKIKQAIPYIPGIFSILLTLGVTAAIYFAQKKHKTYLLKKNKYTALSTLSFPLWLWPAAAVLFGTAFLVPGTNLVSTTLLNLGLVITAFFWLQGFSILATLQKKKRFPAIILVIFFLSMVVFDWLSLLLVGLGIIEPFLKVRKRI